MKTITVGELRQNPTAMLADVEDGETYVITRHGQEVGRIVPPDAGEAVIIPAKKSGGARLSKLPPLELRTANSLDELIEDMKGEW